MTPDNIVLLLANALSCIIYSYIQRTSTFWIVLIVYLTCYLNVFVKGKYLRLEQVEINYFYIRQTKFIVVQEILTILKQL